MRLTSNTFSTILFSSLLSLFGASYAQDAPRATSLTGSERWLSICSDWDDWDKAAPGFHVFGNTYYVGTCGISAILITGDEGHVLIDGGTEAGAKVIADNIENLGFSINDVKVLLHSHEHFDHVAGLAQLKIKSGAKLYASPEAAPVLASGITAENDPQAGMHDSFPAVQVDRVLKKHEIVRLGKLAITAMFTPGHSPGAMSWYWRSCEGSQCYSIVYADSLSAISRDDYRFSDHPIYLENFKEGLSLVANAECDILLAPHPSASKMPSRLASANGLVDSEACAAYAGKALKRLNKRIQEEKQNAGVK